MVPDAALRLGLVEREEVLRHVVGEDLEHSLGERKVLLPQLVQAAVWVESEGNYV